jgi:hypothetical protein
MLLSKVVGLYISWVLEVVGLGMFVVGLGLLLLRSNVCCCRLGRLLILSLNTILTCMLIFLIKVLLNSVAGVLPKVPKSAEGTR